MMSWLILAVGAYLLGSIPFPYLITRLVTSKDLRYAGNGNVGARNTIRVAGRPAGLTALALDACKGAAVYWLQVRVMPGHLGLVIGSAAMMLGHWFPVWLGFRGGIGQGAATGLALAMWPLQGLVGIVVFLIALPLVPLFNIAYAIAAVVLVVASALTNHPWSQIACFLGLMVATIVKKLVDTPRQKRMLSIPASAQETQ